jgi:acetyl-CoA C-acetyltransferase
VISRLSVAEKHGATPLARIVAQAGFAHAPAMFTTAPKFAIRKLLLKAGWSVADVDLFEINEAFAIVPMIAMQELNFPADKVNVNGGACAMGHPIGASGARILTTLIAALRDRGLRRGVASLCIGGGEATAMAVELERAGNFISFHGCAMVEIARRSAEIESVCTMMAEILAQ